MTWPLSGICEGVAAVEIALDDLLDDRPEISALPLESVFIGGEEAVKMMEQHPVENDPLRMSRDEPSARHSPVVPGARNRLPSTDVGPRTPAKGIEVLAVERGNGLEG